MMLAVALEENPGVLVNSVSNGEHAAINANAAAVVRVCINMYHVSQLLQHHLSKPYWLIGGHWMHSDSLTGYRVTI